VIPDLIVYWVAPHGVNQVPTLIARPARVEASGSKPKLIDEYVGRVNSGTPEVSIAHMRSPGGWREPGQTPDFEEFTVVLRGLLRVEHHGGVVDVRAPVRRLLRIVANGSGTARRRPKARNTWPCFPHSPCRPSTGTINERLAGPLSTGASEPGRRLRRPLPRWRGVF